MAPIEASSPRLTLQILSPTEHLEAYHRLLTDPASSAWSSRAINPSIDATRQILKERQSPPDNPGAQMWAICLKPVAEERKAGEGDESDGMGVDEGCGRGNGKFIGAIGLPREAEIGYRLLPEFWGKGYMTEVLGIFVEMFFKLDLYAKYDKLFAGADPENGASCRVLEKGGFTKGEYKKGMYERANSNPGVKTDLQFFYVDRPGK